MIDFPVSGFLTKRFAQGSHELLGRFCDQSAADTATDGVEGTDVSRIPFFICRGSGQGNSDEECCVGHQGQCSDAAPVNGRQSNRRIIAEKGNQQKSKPDGNAAQQASQKPFFVALRPIQNGNYSGQELQAGREGYGTYRLNTGGVFRQVVHQEASPYECCR